MELDADIGRIMDAIRAEAPDTIVIVTADNGAGSMPIPMPEPPRSAARKVQRSKEAGASQAFCGGLATSRQAHGTTR